MVGFGFGVSLGFRAQTLNPGLYRKFSYLILDFYVIWFNQYDIIDDNRIFYFILFFSFN